MGKIEVSLLRALGGVLFGWSLRKYVESLHQRILGPGKWYIESKIFVLITGDTNGSPLGRDLVWNDDVGDWR